MLYDIYISLIGCCYVSESSSNSSHLIIASISSADVGNSQSLSSSKYSPVSPKAQKAKGSTKKPVAIYVLIAIIIVCVSLLIYLNYYPERNAQKIVTKEKKGESAVADNDPAEDYKTSEKVDQQPKDSASEKEANTNPTEIINEETNIKFHPSTFERNTVGLELTTESLDSASVDTLLSKSDQQIVNQSPEQLPPVQKEIANSDNRQKPSRIVCPALKIKQNVTALDDITKKLNDLLTNNQNDQNSLLKDQNRTLNERVANISNDCERWKKECNSIFKVLKLFSNSLLSVIDNPGYEEQTRNAYQKNLNNLYRFMQGQSIETIEPQSGDAFKEEKMKIAEGKNEEKQLSDEDKVLGYKNGSIIVSECIHKGFSFGEKIYHATVAVVTYIDKEQ